MSTTTTFNTYTNAFADAASKAAQAASSSFERLTPEQKWGIGALGGVAGALLASSIVSRSGDYKAKPSAFELTGGSISAENVDKEFKEYSASYAAIGTGKGVEDRWVRRRPPAACVCGPAVGILEARPRARHPRQRPQLGPVAREPERTIAGASCPLEVAQWGSQGVACRWGVLATYLPRTTRGHLRRSKTVHLVDVFYSLVTDIYEVGDLAKFALEHETLRLTPREVPRLTPPASPRCHSTTLAHLLPPARSGVGARASTSPPACPARTGRPARRRTRRASRPSCRPSPATRSWTAAAAWAGPCAPLPPCRART